MIPLTKKKDTPLFFTIKNTEFSKEWMKMWMCQILQQLYLNGKENNCIILMKYMVSFHFGMLFNFCAPSQVQIQAFSSKSCFFDIKSFLIPHENDKITPNGS